MGHDRDALDRLSERLERLERAHARLKHALALVLVGGAALLIMDGRERLALGIGPSGGVGPQGRPHFMPKHKRTPDGG